MKKCNTERIKTINSVITIDSSVCDDLTCTCEQNNLSNAVIMDFDCLLDDLSFYEVTDLTKCEDFHMNKNEETLWRAIKGEIATPKGALSNSVGQKNYGCEIWTLRGQNIDSLLISEFEHYIIKTCIKYPEVHNVLDIETYIGDEGSLLTKFTIDSIFGTFTSEMIIPFAKVSDKHWVNANDLLQGV